MTFLNAAVEYCNIFVHTFGRQKPKQTSDWNGRSGLQYRSAGPVAMVASMIDLLPVEAYTQLEASVSVQSLQQAVRECVRNSIDARSSDIYVRIDCAQLSMLVNDDGEGIGEADLASLGERGCTSSPTTSDTLLRSRGQTLGAIAASSLLEIISKRRGHFQTWRKVFAGRQGSSISLAQRQQPYQGTSVWVPELLSYHPVRRRQLLMDR